MLDLFSGELIFGGTYYWKEFCVSKWVGLDNKSSLKQLALTVANSPLTCIWEGFLSEGFLPLRFWRAVFFFFGGGGGGTEFYGMLIITASGGSSKSVSWRRRWTMNLTTQVRLPAVEGFLSVAEMASPACLRKGNLRWREAVKQGDLLFPPVPPYAVHPGICIYLIQ